MPGRASCSVLAALTPPSGPGEVRDAADRLAVERALAVGPRGDVDGVLQAARDRVLYSGVTMITPSAFWISCGRSQSAGVAPSRSGLNNEMPAGVIISSLREAGASLASA